MSALVEWMDRRFYPKAASHWDAALFRRLIESRLPKQSAVLDLGAGRGVLGEMDFRGRGVFVAGVDIDPAVLTNPFLDEMKLLNPDGSIPYDDWTFDLVLAHNVLEHLADPDSVFREVHRVLRPNGLFLAKTPNRRHYVATVARLTPHRFHVWVNRRRGQEETDVFPTMYRCNTPESIARLASTSAFTVESVTLVEGRPEYLRGSALSYFGGLLYERLMNSTPHLSRFRAVMLTTLRKNGDESANLLAL
jgi:SAM-dependent methyltransferase